MKAFAAILIGFTAVFSACGGDDEQSIFDGSGVDEGADNQVSVNGVTLTEQGAYHDAIDMTPAIDPAVRDAAYLAVARALAEPYLPKPNQNLIYQIRWVESDGVASIKVSGIFPDPSGEGEKETDFRIRQTSAGYWILGDSIDLEFSNAELSQRRAVEREAENDQERQVNLAKLAKIQEGFDSISFEFIGWEPIPDPNGRPGAEGFIVRLAVNNPTQQAHQIKYRLDWSGTVSQATGEKCWGDYYEWTSDYYDLFDTEVQAATQVILEVEPYQSTAYSGRICDDVRIEYQGAVAQQVDGYSQERLQRELAENQEPSK